MSGTQLDSLKIQKAVQAGIPLSLTTCTLPHEMELYIAEVLSAFLKELNQEHMIEYLVYCLNELTTNAKKANTKRIYFKEKNLDITNLKDYEEGMKTFKTDTLENIKHYLELQKKEGYYIKVLFQSKIDKIKIEVRNNTELTFFEYKRIHDKIARAQKYSSIDEAFSQILDETEGAGLGLIIMILMLHKLELTDDNFQIFSENGETIARIILPINGETQKDILQLSSELVTMIDTLPQFPENITHINDLLNNPESKLSDIAYSIANDVALTADLLKLVNSATFSLASPCLNIEDAVKLIGIRGIKNLLYSVASIKNLGSTSIEQKALWTHSYRVAFYSHNLSQKFLPTQKNLIEDSYVCGLLHDMGKVIFDSTHPQFIEKFKTICNKKAMDSQLFEKLISGSNHSEIGSLIAQKWNFPDVIIQTIRYHHTPENTPDDTKMLTYIVYLANMISHYQDGSIEFYQFDLEILSTFKITTEKQLIDISEPLKKLFQTVQKSQLSTFE